MTSEDQPGRFAFHALGSPGYGPSSMARPDYPRRSEAFSRAWFEKANEVVGRQHFSLRNRVSRARPGHQFYFGLSPESLTWSEPSISEAYEEQGLAACVEEDIHVAARQHLSRLGSQHLDYRFADGCTDFEEEPPVPSFRDARAVEWKTGGRLTSLALGDELPDMKE